ncbi:MAG: bacillithiol biosynthesis deacetylase BshB1 [Calditrichota bacterium]
MTFDVLAIGPHPDDLELGCGGTLVGLVDRGYRVAMADLTEALLSTRGDALSRIQEAETARAIIGAPRRFQVGLAESALQSDRDSLERLVNLIRQTQPHILFCPYWDDRHPDHRDASMLIQTACFWSGVSKFGSDLPPHRPHRTIYYFLHREGPPSFIVDISATFDRKLKAIRAYHSQFLSSPGEREMTYISRPEFLEKIINRARYYGSLIGAEYGESFYVRESIRVEDIMTWAGTQGVVG